MIFSKGSKLHVISGEDKFTYLISEASLTQTVREASFSRNTIHTAELVDESFSDTKSPATISIKIHLGSDELFLFSWMGFKPVLVGSTVTGYHLSMGNQNVLDSPDIYMETTTAVYKVSSAVLSTCSFSLGPKAITSVELTGQGSKLELVPSVPTTTNQTIQSSSSFYSSSIEVDGIARLSSVTLEYTRDIKWLGAKGIHQIGEVVYPFNPIVTRYALAGAITCYTDPDNLQLWEGSRAVKITDEQFEFELARCMVSHRLDTASDLHKTLIDFKLIPNNNSFIHII